MWTTNCSNVLFDFDGSDLEVSVSAASHPVRTTSVLHLIKCVFGLHDLVSVPRSDVVLPNSPPAGCPDASAPGLGVQ